jgi:hypothetical protein
LINGQSKKQQWLVDDGKAMAQAAQKGAAIAVSNGSCKDGRGTAAFMLKTSEQLQEEGGIVGVNLTPGKKENQTSHRSKLGGASGIVEATGTICKLQRSITSISAVEAGLDGDQEMKNAFGDWPSDPQQVDCCNLLEDLRNKTKQSPLKWRGCWVEGHQDNQTRFEDLDRWGKLNAECDGLAMRQQRPQCTPALRTTRRCTLRGEMPRCQN